MGTLLCWPPTDCASNPEDKPTLHCASNPEDKPTLQMLQLKARSIVADFLHFSSSALSPEWSAMSWLAPELPGTPQTRVSKIQNRGLAPHGISFVGPLLANDAGLELGGPWFVTDVLAVVEEVIVTAFSGCPHLVWQDLAVNVVAYDRLRRWFHDDRLWCSWDWRHWNWRHGWLLLNWRWSCSASGKVLVQSHQASNLDDAEDDHDARQDAGLHQELWYPHLEVHAYLHSGWLLGVGCWPECLDRTRLRRQW